ncbi:adenosylmethionine decarboxylase [Zavarzinia compransoris]|uniref:Adenosylmethionine decarboxylase n=1 Tax=Zavarzinia compransoris TaxID=1264899 RepID=A0A317E8R6_9PROT|nr:adenosylmethionine decarboxylase [Zavarzinia compransoris]PWR23517.1 adenosylmethionine decarboxylase [Zavarzinia compransoris]TDP47727.1 S-adenosylmethionine decarboxylase [Zavarzinia compransoris]
MNDQFRPSLHLLADFWDGGPLDDVALMERALVEATAACGARLLHLKLHDFGAGGGITGFALLAESHISAHSWPELGLLAVDVFVCGQSEADKALAVFRRLYRPARESVIRALRGMDPA